MLEWIAGLSAEEQAVLAGLMGSVLLQIVKHYIWKPADEAKALKWIVAAIVSAFAALAAAPGNAGEFVRLWLVALGAAQVWHEGTGKLGLKAMWARLVGTEK